MEQRLFKVFVLQSLREYFWLQFNFGWLRASQRSLESPTDLAKLGFMDWVMVFVGRFNLCHTKKIEKIFGRISNKSESSLIFTKLGSNGKESFKKCPNCPQHPTNEIDKSKFGKKNRNFFGKKKNQNKNSPESCLIFIIGIGILETGILSGIDKFETVATIGLTIVLLVITLVDETNEFITAFEIVETVVSAGETELQTSANACNCVVLTSGTLKHVVVVVVHVVVVCKLIQVFNDGIIGIIGITTVEKQKKKHFIFFKLLKKD